MSRRKRVALTALVVGYGILAGCAGRTPRAEKAPAWADRCSGVFPGPDGLAIYGVGVVPRLEEPARQDAAAVAVARTDLTRQIEIYVSDLTKDFLRKHPELVDADSAAAVRFVRTVSEAVAASVARGAVRAAQWRDPPTQALYVLVRADLATVLANVGDHADRTARTLMPDLFGARTDQALRALADELTERREMLNRPPGGGRDQPVTVIRLVPETDVQRDPSRGVLCRDTGGSSKSFEIRALPGSCFPCSVVRVCFAFCVLRERQVRSVAVESRAVPSKGPAEDVHAAT